jgi:beta-barrel assembly-enhancing protease
MTMHRLLISTIVLALALPVAAQNPLDSLRELKDQIKQPAKPAPQPAAPKEAAKPAPDAVAPKEAAKEVAKPAAPDGAAAGTAQAAAKEAPKDPAADLPSIPPFGEVPVQDEVKIGRHIAGSLLGAAPLVADPELQQYVNRVGRWIASRSERPDLKWTFGVIESSDINAFAAPGGYIFVTRGLYSLLRDEAELAGVLAHEIAHVARKHHLKVMQQSQMIGAGSDLLTKRLAKKDDKVKSLIGSGAEIMARGLDKDAEFEADRDGVVLAARAGYDSYGLPSVLQELARVSSASSTVALLFKTHPHPDERLTRLGDAMGSRFDRLKDARSLPERLQKAKM